MVIRTFLEKCNTIIKDSDNNLGLNPILMLHYGGLVSRIIISFDIDLIKERMGENTDYTHTLKLFNCGSIDGRNFASHLPSFCGSGERKRATSFDVIAFEIPNRWDSGVGFDTSSDLWLVGNGAVSNNGSNWYQAYNGKNWDYEGIFSNDYLSSEYTKFGNGEESIIISRQHFNYGNEHLELDLTNYINNIIRSKKKTHGICLAFSPLLEDSFSDFTQYVGFFGKHTNTFFHPCIESRKNQSINDNRFDFRIGKENKLYFIVENNGEYVCLDELPVCTINNTVYEVKQEGKGIYYSLVKLNKEDVDDETVLYDVWSNIIVDGEKIDDIEMSFIAYYPSHFINFGTKKRDLNNYEVQLNGVNDYEKLKRGEKREISVNYREKFTNNVLKHLNGAEYRLYIEENNREMDVISWDYVDKINDTNLFLINTSDLVPSNYFIDIRIKHGNEIKVFKKCLEFSVINNKTLEKY